MTSTKPIGTIGSIAFFLAATLHQGNPDRNHKLWNIRSTERYNSMKLTTTSHSLNTEKTTCFADGNQNPGIGTWYIQMSTTIFVFNQFHNPVPNNQPAKRFLTKRFCKSQMILVRK